MTSPKLLWKAAALAAIAALIVLGWTQRHRFLPVDVGSMAPAYSARRLDGGVTSLESLRGKVVLLNIWATWCGPCVREMPAIERAYQTLRAQGFEVLAVSVDAPAGSTDPFGRPGGDIAEFTRELGLSFPIAHDPDKEIESLFGIIGLPTTLIIDRSGRIAVKVLGGAAWDDAEHLAQLRALLAHRP